MHSFPLIFCMVYIPECKQQLRTMKYTCRYEILHILNLGGSFITLGEQSNNQQPRCDITWLHVTNHLYLRVRLLNSLTENTVV